MGIERSGIVVIGDLPPDVRDALSADFHLRDHLLEGPGARDVDGLPRDCRAIATRAVLGVPPGVIEALPDLGLVLSLGAGVDRIDQPRRRRCSDGDRRSCAALSRRRRRSCGSA